MDRCPEEMAALKSCWDLIIGRAGFSKTYHALSLLALLVVLPQGLLHVPSMIMRAATLRLQLPPGFAAAQCLASQSCCVCCLPPGEQPPQGFNSTRVCCCPSLKLLPQIICPLCLQNIYLFAAEGDTSRSRPKPQRLRPDGREMGISPAKRQRHAPGQIPQSAAAGKRVACSIPAKANLCHTAKPKHLWRARGQVRQTASCWQAGVVSASRRV